MIHIGLCEHLMVRKVQSRRGGGKHKKHRQQADSPLPPFLGKKVKNIIKVSKVTGPSLHNTVSISDKERASPHTSQRKQFWVLCVFCPEGWEHSSSGCAPNHSPPSIVEANNTWSCTSMPPTASLDAGLTNTHIYKGKVIPLQARCGPESG